MQHTSTLDRRRLFQSSLASLSLGVVGLRMRNAAAAVPAVTATASATAVLSILAAAKAGLARVAGRVVHTDVIGVADFGRPSSQPRLHLIDIAAGKVTSLLVAHGRGSDPRETGWLTSFSNTPGSAATSQGAYLTGEYYQGEHGRSMRLDGLDPTNSNARDRDIVVHSAWYVGQDLIRSRGMIGRSEGCFALSQVDLPQVLSRLGPGRLLLAAKL